MQKCYCVYLMTNKANRVIYCGMTGDLKVRVYQHKTGAIEGFTKRYNIKKLVYYKVFETAYSAIVREKQIKGGSRQKKVDLIRNKNPEWRDLYDQI
jgi:putative endonuclease